MKKHPLRRFPKCCFAKKEQFIWRRNLISIDSMVGKSLFDSQLEKVWWSARGVFWKRVDPYLEIELRLSEYYVDSLFWEHYTEKESKISYVTISLWNATEWSDEMETLAREKYVPLVMSMGASSVKIVQTGELSFAVITTYDSDYCNGSTTAYCWDPGASCDGNAHENGILHAGWGVRKFLKLQNFPRNLVCRN